MSKSTTWQRSGRTSLDIAALLNRLAPPAIWVEPDPVLPDERLAMGYPASRGLLAEPPSGVPLVEARGFWPTWAVHLIADGDSSLWMAIGDGERPVWPDELADFDEHGPDVVCTHQPVLLRRRWGRFGIDEGAEPEHPAEKWRRELHLVEYRERGQCIAWRLAPAKMEGQ